MSHQSPISIMSYSTFLTKFPLDGSLGPTLGPYLEARDHIHRYISLSLNQKAQRVSCSRTMISRDLLFENYNDRPVLYELFSDEKSQRIFENRVIL